MRQTTVGWKCIVRWKDGTVTWTSLKDLKESKPIEMSDYVKSGNIEHEPAFA